MNKIPSDATEHLFDHAIEMGNQLGVELAAEMLLLATAALLARAGHGPDQIVRILAKRFPMNVTTNEERAH